MWSNETNENIILINTIVQNSLKVPLNGNEQQPKMQTDIWIVVAENSVL